jgi:hypothetical protein
MKHSNKHYDDLIASENDENFGNINMKNTYGLLFYAQLTAKYRKQYGRVESSCRYNRDTNINDINFSCLQQQNR